ncbi:DNA polymerase III subunit delta' [Sedimentitalea arenosa]|uniref:DNA polymerase III subunit delta n=1 Tax=Sedimentitalea arenosa TaxID=2798803 RepID=A0A8J7IV91_9RHOB|nr:DNA polymerase III subunit delta' [Arenibacterium arenosum]MBJ6373561.1 DNA polymerase III subunit delta' [Arenibacterium arenosum]
MSIPDEPPVPDQAPGAPHPRETSRLYGQDEAEAAFLTAFASDRLHHGWLLTGPRGVGKATLAWRIARFLLATPPRQEAGLFGASPKPDTLDIPNDHPVMARTLALSDPGLFLVRRGWAGSTESDRDKARKEGRRSAEIRVHEIRQLARFLNLSSSDGGRRVVIVDCADEMNGAAANALLKMLEEPPARTTMLLVSHQPSGLLPTVRSRCRVLRLAPLGAADMQAALAATGAALPDTADAVEQLAALANGSVGAALRLLTLDGLAVYRELVAILESLPRLDRQRALALANAAAQRGASDRFELLLTLVDTVLVRLARTGVAGAAPNPEACPGEAQILQRLAATPAMGRAWADIAATITARARHGQAVNLDPAALVLDTVFKMQETAAQARPSPIP